MDSYQFNALLPLPHEPSRASWSRIRQIVTARAREVQTVLESYAERSCIIGQCDRSAAEAAVTSVYRAINFPTPEFVWFESPLAAMRAAAALPDDESLAVPFLDEAAPRGYSELMSAIRDQVNSCSKAFSDHDFRIAFTVKMSDHDSGIFVRTDHNRRITSFRLGAGDGWDLAVVAAGCLLGAPAGPTFAPLCDTMTSCGWWWPFKTVCVMCERPEVLRLHEYKLHMLNDAAVRYPDGFELYFLDDLPVSKNIAYGEFSAQDIDAEPNVVLRRLMIERIGMDRYLHESGAKKINQDSCGTLYRKELPEEESMVVVRVKNSTPEPDGTYKHYYLRVPPHVNTAREAVAWTFGLAADEYRPMVET